MEYYEAFDDSIYLKLLQPDFSLCGIPQGHIDLFPPPLV